jgi:hypothetical protein
MVDCSFLGCGRQAEFKGLCSAHYRQQKKGKALKPIRALQYTHAPTCSICDKPYYSRGFCEYHYKERWSKKKTLENLKETRNGKK